jgi:hypothetical protein
MPPITAFSIPDLNAKIDSIITDINSSSFGESERKFSEFIDRIVSIGRYNPVIWDETFCKKLYELGKLISEYPSNHIEILRQAIISTDEDKREILYFIESEIKINLWGWSEPRTKEYLINLNNSYPNNPEFLNDLGQVIDRINNDKLNSIDYCLKAIKIAPGNQGFLATCLTQEINYIESLIENEKFDEATAYTNEIVLNRKTYESDFVYKNWIIAIQSRIKDHILIRSTLLKKETQIQSRIEEGLEKERFKAIEMIGVFTAIIAFIFSTISFAKDYSYSETLLLIITFGLVLILFSLAVSLLFQSKDKAIFKDTRIYTIIFILLFLTFIYFYTK